MKKRHNIYACTVAHTEASEKANEEKENRDKEVNNEQYYSLSSVTERLWKLYTKCGESLFKNLK